MRANGLPRPRYACAMQQPGRDHAAQPALPKSRRGGSSFHTWCAMQGETLDELPRNVCSDTSSVYGGLSARPGAAVAKMIVERTGARIYHLPNPRPAEVATLLGNPAKAKADLGWVPQVTLPEIVASDLHVSKEACAAQYARLYSCNCTRVMGLKWNASAKSPNAGRKDWLTIP